MATVPVTGSRDTTQNKIVGFEPVPSGEPANSVCCVPLAHSVVLQKVESDRSFVSVIGDRQNFTTSAIGACRLPITD